MFSKEAEVVMIDQQILKILASFFVFIPISYATVLNIHTSTEKKLTIFLILVYALASKRDLPDCRHAKQQCNHHKTLDARQLLLSGITDLQGVSVIAVVLA